jgi:hypothetical protein
MGIRDGRIVSHSWYDQNGEVYPRTGRTLKKLQEEYFIKGELNPKNLRRKRVLDAGTGTGNLVEDLAAESIRNNLGIHVEGIDLVISKEMALTGRFHAMDMRKTSYQNGQWDVIVSTVSLFTHGSPEIRGLRGRQAEEARQRDQRDSLLEYKRICASKCLVLLADASENVVEIARELGFSVEYYGNAIARLVLDGR